MSFAQVSPPASRGPLRGFEEDDEHAATMTAATMAIVRATSLAGAELRAGGDVKIGFVMRSLT